MGNLKDDQSVILKDRTLKGHRAGIQCIAISPDGNSILSGDDDAFLFVWNIKTGEVVQKISVPFNGAVGAAVWLALDEEGMSFAFGCADGSIHTYKERQNSRGAYDFVSMVDSPGPIESISFDHAHRRLGSVGGGCLQIWKVTDTSSLVPFNEERVQKTVVAKNVNFTDDGNSVIVYYLESHEISCYSIEPWTLKWTKLVPTRIGHASMCMADGAFLYISNLLDGVDQYKFPSLEKVQSFTHPISVNLPLQVASAARGQWVVCGGDSGFVRVFNRRTGQVLQILDHCEKAHPVQTIATHELEDRSLIVTGSSGEGDCDLQIWYERIFEPQLPGALCETGNSGETHFLSTAKTIVLYTFVAVFAMELVIGGSLYLFWPAIRPALEHLLHKPVPTLTSEVHGATFNSVPTFEPDVPDAFNSAQSLQASFIYENDKASQVLVEKTSEPTVTTSFTSVSTFTIPTPSSVPMRTIDLDGCSSSGHMRKDCVIH